MVGTASQVLTPYYELLGLFFNVSFLSSPSHVSLVISVSLFIGCWIAPSSHTFQHPKQQRKNRISTLLPATGPGQGVS
jgi:hypothetical protein